MNLGRLFKAGEPTGRKQRRRVPTRDECRYSTVANATVAFFASVFPAFNAGLNSADATRQTQNKPLPGLRHCFILFLTRSVK